MRKVANILICVVSLVVAGCTFPDGDGERDNVDNVVARVDRKCLMRDDVARDMPAGLSGVDSVTFVRMYVDNWVLNQLKMRRAEEVLSSYEAEIERLVEGYRQSLIMRQLDQYYVDKAIDVDITDKQLSAYYRANSASFKLDHDIVRGVIVKAPRTFRNTATLSTALKGVAKSGSTEEVAAIAEKHNLLMTDYALQWVSYSDFLSNLPTERSRSYVDLLDKSGVQQMTSDDALFHFIITDVVREGSVAPLECVEGDIRRRLYAERRAEIVSGYEGELKREAVEAGRVSLKDTVLLNAMGCRGDGVPVNAEVREAAESIEDMEADSVTME